MSFRRNVEFWLWFEPVIITLLTIYCIAYSVIFQNFGKLSQTTEIRILFSKRLKIICSS